MIKRSCQNQCLFSLLLLAAVFLLFGQAYWFDFLNFDDDIYVANNPFVNSGISWSNIVWAFTESHGGHWHPITWVSHMMDCTLFGLRPGPMHLMNVSLHAINTLLVFWLVNRVTPATGRALFIALIFGLHPLRLESVAWISERKDVLSVLWGLVAIHAYVSFTQKRSILRFLLTLVPFCISLLCKPTLVTLPALLLLMDLWPLKRWEDAPLFSKRTVLLLAEKIPFLICSATSSILAILAQQADGGLKSTAVLDWPERLANISISYSAYIGKLFWPVELGIFYPLQIYPPGVGAGAFILLFILGAFCIGARKRHPALLFGALWFVISLLPVVGVLQIGGQTFADRWTYLPHFGLVWGLSVAATEAASSRWKNLYLPVLGCVFVIFCAALTHHQLPFWRDSISIFSRTLEVAPNNFMAHTNLGSALDEAGRLDEAAPHFEAALHFAPEYPEALNNLGSLRARQRRFKEAIELFTKALSIRPSMIISRYNLALTWNNLGRPFRTIAETTIILAQNPNYSPAQATFTSTLNQFTRLECSQVREIASGYPPEDTNFLKFQIEQWHPSSALQDLATQLSLLRPCLP